MTDASVFIPAQQLEQFLADIFDAAGCSQPEARRIARHLVKANLAGHDSHGAVRVVRYIPLQKEGLIRADQQVEVRVDTPAIAVIDGKFGYGQTVAPQAVAIGIRKCKAMGLSAVALRNAGHVGRVADWAEMAAAEGLVSIHFVNAASSPIVAPFGSSDRRFSTAPFCMGVPVREGAPLLLDFATSVVAEGKVLVASQGGRPIPTDALIGPDGRTSDDATLLYGDYRASGQRDVRNGTGALRAFGEHKGSGLALMCELLGGALTGGGCAKPGARFANGMLSVYLDPAQIDPDEFFPAEVGRYLEYVKAARAAPPAEEILFPGEPEDRTKAQRLGSGIPIPAETWALIQETARSVGVDAGRIPAAAAHR